MCNRDNEMDWVTPQLQQRIEQPRAQIAQERRNDETTGIQYQHLEAIKAVFQDLVAAAQKRKDAETRLSREKADLARAKADRAYKVIEYRDLWEFLADSYYDLMMKYRCQKTGRSYSTNVDGLRYPKKLIPWAEFEEKQQQQFDIIKDLCGERRVFHHYMPETRHQLKNMMSGRGRETEADILFSYIAIMEHVDSILNIVLENEEMQAKTSCCHITLRERRMQGDLCGRDSEGETHVSCVYGYERDPLRKGWVRKNRAVCLYGYKSSHKIPPAKLESYLENKDLFTQAAEMVRRKRMRQHKKKTRKLPDACIVLSEGLAEIYAHMWDYGLRYGCLFVGDSIVLAHIRDEEPEVLYYHHIRPRTHLPNDWTRGFTKKQLSYTPVSQVACFFLLALMAKPLTNREHGTSMRRTREIVKLWPNPYPLLAASSDRSTVTTSLASSTLSSESPRKDERGNLDCEGISFEPTKPYCTQACLLGLKRGWNLDENCPNVESHRTAESGKQHPVDIAEFTHLVKKQLDQDPYQYCDCLADVRGGHAGRTGLLFKVELAQYGYTVVSKGSRGVPPTTMGPEEFEWDFQRTLEYEGSIYSQLDKLQGEAVPVHLGFVHLTEGYLPIGGHPVWRMMLMSWAGECWDDRASDIVTKRRDHEANRSLDAIANEGVAHWDPEERNLMWCQERGRIMVVDFDRAAIFTDPSLQN